MIDKVLRKLHRIFGKESTKLHGLNLPNFRSNQGLEDNQKYLDSAVAQINHVKEVCGLDSNTVFLDFGCGQGRIVNGLEYSKTKVGRYEGVDTILKSITWDKKWLGGYGNQYTFSHLPAFNARYNKDAEGLRPLPFNENTFDVIFLNSVFSHMILEDVKYYLEEFLKVLKPNGQVYFTAFIEENVPDFEENPDNYVRPAVGALHHVRFDKKFLFDIIENMGYEIDGFFYRKFERSHQSITVIRKKK